MLQSSSASDRPSLLMPSLAVLVAAGIFIVDTATTLDIAIAVLYVAVVLLAMDFAGRNGVLIVAGLCAVLTVLSYAISHEADASGGPFLRCLISLVAIAVTGALAGRHQGAIAALREHANLLNLTHDTIFVRDQNDVITYWNRAAVELYGWRPDQAIGRKAAELLHTEFPAPFEEVMAGLRSTGRWEGELVHTGRDGRRIVVASRWALQRDRSGRPAAILETNNDVTARRAVEDGLHRAQGELAHVARVATLGELTASIAHEVNQPLAAVVTNGEACLRWLGRAVPDISQATSSVEQMIKNAQRASEVVRRLRALSRKDEPTYGPLSLVDVVNDVALLVGRELQVHRATLAVNGADGAPRVQGDRVQLQQVVMNLLMNGIQAMDGVNSRPRRLAVDVARSTEDPKAVVLTVSDAGPGIDPASLDRLFDAFFTTRKDGMGMGLSISRSIVEAHGGRIWATNRPGNSEENGQPAGARFHVSLPIAEEPQP